MGGAGSTVQFERSPHLIHGGPQGPPDKREEGGPHLSVGRRSTGNIWHAPDGDNSLDAVLHALTLQGNEFLLGGPGAAWCPQPSSECLLQHHQLVLAWRLSRRGAPGRCGCSETLLLLGSPAVRRPYSPGALGGEALRPCGSSSSRSCSAVGDRNARRDGSGLSPWRPSVGEGSRRACVMDAPQPDPSSCYLIIHAYTAAQQQQQRPMSDVTEGLLERRRSVTPPHEASDGSTAWPPEGSPWTAEADPRPRGLQQTHSSSISSSEISGAMMSKDLLRLLSQADTLITAYTRRHSVWHSVQPCCCCPGQQQQQSQQQQQQQQSQQQQQQQQQQGWEEADGSKTPTENSRVDKAGVPGPETAGSSTTQQQQQQQQHLWAVYLWEGVEAPRYILDHARLRTLRLVETLEGCEQRGAPVAPAALLPWGSLAVVLPHEEGPPWGPPLEFWRGASFSGAPEEQPADAGVLLKQNVLLLRLIKRPPRLAPSNLRFLPSNAPLVAATSVPAAAATPVPAAAATPVPAAAATPVPAAAATTEGNAIPPSSRAEMALATSSSPEPHRDEQAQRFLSSEAPVPRLALTGSSFSRLQQHQHQQSELEGFPRRCFGSSGGLGAVAGEGSSVGLPAAASAYRDSRSVSRSSMSFSPVPSSPGSPAGGHGHKGEDAHAAAAAPGGSGRRPRLQGGLRLQGVPKLAIPRLGGAGGFSSATAADDSLSRQRRGPCGASPFGALQEAVPPRGPQLARSSQPADAGGPSPPLSREGTVSSPLAKQQQRQQQQLLLRIPAEGLRGSGASSGSLSSLRPSGAPTTPAASPRELQRRASTSEAARDLLSLRRRRVEDDGMGLYSRTRQQQLYAFRRVISDVYCGRLFVAGAAAACDLKCLEGAGITHVVNTIGGICPNAFPSHFVYKTYYLKDTRYQDIVSVFYDCIRFVWEAIGGDESSPSSPTRLSSPHAPPSSCSSNSSSTGKQHRVLIHCKEGVSRSAALAIAFLMWRCKLPFADAFELLRRRRAICSPNTGFTFQLLLLQKRLGIPNRRGAVGPADGGEGREDGGSSPLALRSLRRSLPGGSSSPSEAPKAWSPAAGRGCPQPAGASPDRNSSASGIANSWGPSPRPAFSKSSPPAGAPPPSFNALPALPLPGACWGGGGRQQRPLEAGKETPPGSGELAQSSQGHGPKASRTSGLHPHTGDTAGAGDTHTHEESNPPASAPVPLEILAQPVRPHPRSPRHGGDQQRADGAAAASPAPTGAAAAAAGQEAEGEGLLLLRLVVHSPHSPNFLLWAELTDWKPGVPLAFSEKGVYLFRCGHRGWLWRDNSKCLRSAADVEAAAKDYLINVALVEGQELHLQFIAAGHEPAEFWEALGVGPPYPHLGAPNILSGLEPMPPEEPDEAFHWLGYCGLEAPDFGGQEGWASSGASSRMPQDVPRLSRQGPPEGPYGTAKVGGASSPQTAGRNNSGKLSSARASVRRSFELRLPAAVAAAAPAAAAATPSQGVATDGESAAARLFCLSDLKEPLDLFDSEDLLSHEVFLLLAEGESSSSNANTPTAAPADAPAAARAWLWVGDAAAFDPKKDLEETKRKVAQAFSLESSQLNLSVELEGQESEAFWSHFANG